MGEKQPTRTAEGNFDVYSEVADEMIESLSNFSDRTPPAELFELVESLPEALNCALHFLMDGFDYKNNLASSRAIGCRIIATMSGALAYRLNEAVPKEPGQERC